jgi:hypothetical protein
MSSEVGLFVDGNLVDSAEVLVDDPKRNPNSSIAVPLVACVEEGWAVGLEGGEEDLATEGEDSGMHNFLHLCDKLTCLQRWVWWTKRRRRWRLQRWV